MRNEKYQIMVPLFNIHRGHPVLIDKELMEELENLDDEKEGLRGFLNKYKNQVGYMITENSGVRRDIDYKSDIQPHEK